LIAVVIVAYSGSANIGLSPVGRPVINKIEIVIVRTL